MPRVQVQFLGVDWKNEEYKSERGSLQRKTRKVRRREYKAFNKMAAAETEKLKRFRRFLHCLNDDALRPLLTERLVGNFFDDDGHRQQNLNRLQNELASDDILHNDEKLAALTLLRENFIRQGHFGPADDFLQTLFAMDDLENIVDDNKGLFQGHLEGFYALGDYEENKGRFLQRDLCVAHIAGDDGAGSVLELKQLLIQQGIVIDEVEGDDNTHGASTSGSS